MRYQSIDPKFFVTNRSNLSRLLPPNALAAVNANDILPTNASAVGGRRRLRWERLVTTNFGSMLW